MVQFLQELVRIPSVTGHEGNAQKLIEKKLMSLGIETDVWEPDVEELKKYPAFFETTSYVKFGYNARPNVVGRLIGSGGGRSLILAGHIDVVSPEPTSAWKHDPWGGEIVEGKLYGRGAGDMKGGIAAIILAVQCLQEAGLELKGDLIIESTIEEEDGGIGGALATILKGYTANAAIVTEPTMVNSIGIASAGVMYFRIKVPGRTAHAAFAHMGVDAIAKAMKIYDALMALNEKRQRRIRYPPAEVEPDMKGHATTINIGKILGGDWPSTVAGLVELEGRVGWPPKEKMEDVKKEIEETVEKVSQSDSWLKNNPPNIEWFGWRANPSEQNRSHPVVQIVARNIKEITGNNVMFTGGSAGLDTRFFILYAGMPAITFGPRGYNIHGVDEYVELASIVETAKILALTILEWCGY